VRELTGDQLSERIELAGRALYYGARSGHKQLTLDQRITLRGAVQAARRERTRRVALARRQPRFEMPSPNELDREVARRLRARWPRLALTRLRRMQVVARVVGR
jgi:hypothetical protein